MKNSTARRERMLLMITFWGYLNAVYEREFAEAEVIFCVLGCFFPCKDRRAKFGAVYVN